jgi:hypothetical protein
MPRLRTALLAAALAAIAAIAAPAAATDSLESDLVAMERASWIAWKGHDAKFFADFLSEDHVEVHGYGVTSKAEVVAGVGGTACTVESYALNQFRFRRVSSNAALLVYRAEQTTTCGGNPVPSPVWATSVYAKRNGRWVNVLYQQTPLPKKPQ